MVEDRVWGIILEKLGSLDKKLDAVAEDVAALRQASTDVVRRVVDSEQDIKALQVVAATHAQTLDRHDRQLRAGLWLAAAVLLAVVGTLVPPILKVLASVL